MSKKDLLSWAKDRWEIVALVVGALGLLSGSKFIPGGSERLQALEVRVDTLEAGHTILSALVQTVDALALAECLKEISPIARQQLRCGDRERQAGIRR